MLTEILTVVVSLGVFVVFDPLTALTSILYFAIVVIAQHRTLANLPQTSAVSMTASLSGYRSSLADARGRSIFISMVPRYLLELTLATGILVMGGVAYVASGPTQALTAVVLFTGVSFRLLPVVNRIQVLALTIISDMPTADRVDMPMNTERLLLHEFDQRAE